MSIHDVGVVIPAFNEEINLRGVLDSICAIQSVAQIVVVDDGSTDDTCTVAQHCAQRDERLIVLRLPHNLGKADAMLKGVRALQTPLTIFLDADLIGLRPHHLHHLYKPVSSHACDMTVAVFRHGGMPTDISHRIAPVLGGQRCLWRVEAEQALAQLRGSGYGVEVGLTAYARQRNWQIQYVAWEQMTHVMKEQKRGWMAGMASRWQMYRQVVAALVAGEKRAFLTRDNLHPKGLRRLMEGAKR